MQFERKCVKKLVLIVLMLPVLVWAQDPYMDLDKGFRDIGEIMLITAGDVDSLALARTPMMDDCKEDVDLTPKDIDLGLTPKDQAKSKWRFSVMTSMGGPKDKLKKHYADKDDNYRAMGDEVDNIIAQNFSNHNDRVQAIKNMCAGKSEMEKIAMASNLASRLSRIYDYDRIDNGPNVNQVVMPENQWNALHSRAGGNYNATSGVCRDASLTVSRFLMDCGFSKDQVAIEQYRTVGGGHQVTSVRTKDGELYTINWSELYKSDEAGGVNAAPEPNLVNTGLFYSVFDPETGKIVEKRSTELGQVLKAVTGGSVDDPNHLPQLLRLEAGYGVISANYFQTSTARGDFARGVSAYIKKDNVLGILDLTAGVAYARNERAIATSDNEVSGLKQDILYGQIEGRFVIPELRLIDREEQSLSLRPSAVVMTEGFISRDALNNQPKLENKDFNTEITLGLDGLYNRGRFGAYLGGEVDVNLSDSKFNNQRGTLGANGDNGGVTPFANSYNVHGGISWDGDRFTTALTGEHTIARSGSRTSFGAILMDKEGEVSYSAIYSHYDRDYGIREDFLVLRAEKDFVIQKVGRVNIGLEAQMPIADDFNETTVGITMRFSPF